MNEKIGLFGGTFNPIHSGHVKAGLEVKARFGLSKVLFIPSYIPPHKGISDIASAGDRFRMVEFVCRDHPGFVASSIEVDARETSYSILTLERAKELYPKARFFFILGVDAFLEIGTWREYERVLSECLFIVITRPGFRLEAASHVLGERLATVLLRTGEKGSLDETLFSRYQVFLLPIEALDISATDIRNRLRRRQSIIGLVPEAVRFYIQDRKLYLDNEEPCPKK